MGFQYGLSGMNAASKNLDVIGNNVANANTTGFKSSRTEFTQMFGSAVGSSSNMTSGQGVSVGAITQQFLQGNFSSTGNALDVAINGNGFLQLEMPDGTTAYTRSGSLQIDKDGQLVNRQGAKVMGFKTDLNPENKQITSTIPSAITLPIDKAIANKTSEIAVIANLDASALSYVSGTNTPVYTTYSSSFDVYKSDGKTTPVDLYFVKNAANSWNVHYRVNNSSPFAIDATATGNKLSTVTFKSDGSIETQTPSPKITFPDADGTTNINASVDLKGLTQNFKPFSVSELDQNGGPPGYLNNVTIEPDGTILARYSNGVSQSQGRLVLAKFNNLQGLVSTTGGNWIQTPESGIPTKGTPSSENFGSIQSGSLEESNVDLTAELVNMMTAQRSYQANAQSLKTQDQVMSTLVNLR